MRSRYGDTHSANRFETLSGEDMPELESSVRKLLAPIAPATTIDGIIQGREEGNAMSDSTKAPTSGGYSFQGLPGVVQDNGHRDARVAGQHGRLLLLQRAVV